VSYQVHLPKVFPYVMMGTQEQIYKLVKLLMDPARVDVPAGSSFAVTAGAGPVDPNGGLCLWLSQISHAYLMTLGPERWREETVADVR
jgi:hypothetical protein